MSMLCVVSLRDCWWFRFQTHVGFRGGAASPKSCECWFCLFCCCFCCCFFFRHSPRLECILYDIASCTHTFSPLKDTAPHSSCERNGTSAFENPREVISASSSSSVNIASAHMPWTMCTRCSSMNLKACWYDSMMMSMYHCYEIYCLENL